MVYPEAFKKRVKKAYPNNLAIAQALETDISNSLLNLLKEENSKFPNSIAEIKSYSSKELDEQQKIMAERVEIYEEFFEIYERSIIG